MALRDEEDFELVLGNRQLFFLAVVLFGVFFSIGYTVGYSRGRNRSDAVAAATREASQPASAAQLPPAAPPKEAAEEPAAATAAAAEPAGSSAHETGASSQPDSKAADAGVNGSQREVAQSSAASRTEASHTKASPTEPAARHEPVVREVASSAPRSAAPGESAAARPRVETAVHHAGSQTAVAHSTPPAVSRTEPARPSAKPPTSASPPAAPSSTATVPAANIVPGTMYLQVLASKDAGPARKALLDLKAKGHPVALDNEGGEWYRILVGPFQTREEADAYMGRLKAEGINSFLRKF